ncbi:MAG: MarR family transcriptional regulator [Balneolales bacterium]
MSLEDEIKQKTFKNDHEKGIINLIFTYNYISASLQKFLHAHNLTLQQYNILKILRGQHPNRSTNGMIRDRMLDKNSDVTRIVDRLIKEGLATRENCANDRRCVNIYITEKGMALLANLDGYSDKMDNLLGNLSDQEAADLNDLLDKIRR